MKLKMRWVSRIVRSAKKMFFFTGINNFCLEVRRTWNDITTNNVCKFDIACTDFIGLSKYDTFVVTAMNLPVQYSGKFITLG
jgi:hypothetical protein